MRINTITKPSGSKIFYDREKIKRLRKIARNFKRAKENLQERFKEGQCLTTINRLIENKGEKPETIIQKIIQTLPQAWSISDIMCACLELKARHFRPADCPGKSTVKLHYDHVIASNGIGGLSRFCCKQEPPKGVNPFDKKKKEFCRLAAALLKEFLSRIELAQKVALLEEKVPLAAAAGSGEQHGKVRTLTPIVGQSAKMMDLKKVIEKAAASDANVIIYSDAGGGKELAARTIHNLSKRRNKPFLVFNCAAVPADFLQYNLADSDSPIGDYLPKNLGSLPAADGGTLFLELVGELDLEMQARFLRLLDKKALFKDFDGSVRPLNLRVIAATHRNLSTDMHLGRVRADFYYRLHAMPIIIPSLREWHEDIPLLVKHFLSTRKPPVPPDAVSGKIMETLMHYHWPGNVRELKNVLYRYLDMGKLELDVIDFVESKSGAPPGMAQEFESLREVLVNAEKKHILETLQKANWDRQKTAALLKISRNSLFRKIKTYALKQISNVSK